MKTRANCLNSLKKMLKQLLEKLQFLKMSLKKQTVAAELIAAVVTVAAVGVDEFVADNVAVVGDGLETIVLAFPFR